MIAACLLVVDTSLPSSGEAGCWTSPDPDREVVGGGGEAGRWYATPRMFEGDG
jgi:hypothetical protein